MIFMNQVVQSIFADSSAFDSTFSLSADLMKQEWPRNKEFDFDDVGF